MQSAQLSDVGSHSGAGAGDDENASTRSYFFGTSTVMVSRIQGMINNSYFAEGMCHEPREETMSEPQPDEAMVFEEFFAAGLRMPLHPIFSDILLNFWVQIHHLTPNAIVQLLKYIYAMTSFGGAPLLMVSPKDVSYTTNQGR
jgi:hypothetical protein